MGRKSILIIIIMMMFGHPSFSLIIINEIMIDPADENTGEFIEIYNSGSLPVNLCNYYLCDEQDTDKIIIFSDSLLLPTHFALILDPNYIGEYDELIPDTCALFSIEDSRFGKYGISNSSEKTFSILDSNLLLVESYHTGTPEWPAPGFSIERYLPTMNTWASSLVASGTPGSKNSISPKSVSFAIKHIYTRTLGDSIKLSFVLKNTGLNILSKLNYHINIFDTTLLCENKQDIPSMDSIIVNENIPIICKGENPIRIIAFTDGYSDTLQSTIDVQIKENDFIISEFVCRTGDQFSCEYIEIISLSETPIQMRGVEIHDMTGSIIIDTNYVLKPDSLLLIAQSSLFHDDFPKVRNVIYPHAWRSLNNNEDLINFSNASSTSICSLEYNSDWGLQNDCAMLLVDTSLNYRSAKNWECCESGSPGKINQTQKQLKQLHCHIPKEIYTPDDTLRLMIINTGYQNVKNFQLELNGNYTDIAEIQAGDTLICFPDTTWLTTPGTNKISVSSRPYFDTSFYYYRPYSETPCLFNEIMFEPNNSYAQEEFIEIENRHLPILYQGWTLLINNHTIILRDSSNSTYSVFCDDNDVIASYSSSCPQASFPNLPNSGAELMLLDPMDNIIDQCDVRDHKEIVEGRSLEKQFRGIASNNKNVWHASVSSDGMTPGKTNSISALPGGRNSLGVYPQIFSPDENELIQFSIDSETGLEFCELHCYNLGGQLIYKKDQNCFSNASALIFWSGRLTDNSFPSRGIYLVTVTLHDINGNTYRLKNTLIIK